MDALVAVPLKRFDPMLHDIELCHTAAYYPAGFPLHIATNSRHVLEAAAESWRYWHREYDAEPVIIRAVIEPAGPLAGTPTFRMQEHLLQAVSDAHNFATMDMRLLVAGIHVSEKTAADHPRLRWFFIESMGYMMLTQRYVTPVHAACVARRGLGLLLCGASGAGKSTLAFACARAGWTYVTDDCSWLLTGSTDRVVIGRPHQMRFRHDAVRHFPELQGHVARTRPNGKLSIEVLTNLFPSIRTEPRCPVGGIVFLDRAAGGHARTEPIDSGEAVASLIADMPSYGDEVNAMHERTVRALLDVPAWRLHYRSFDEALRLLSEIQPE